MNSELTKKLVDKYPAVFTNMGKSPMESNMAFGLDIGDGWYNVIDYLLASMTLSGRSYNESCKLDGLDEHSFEVDTTTFVPVADQIKEKFATLRFYYHIEVPEKFKEQAKKWPITAKLVIDEISDRFDAQVSMAEVISSMTCETTGLPGELHTTGGWLKTLNREWAKANDPRMIPYTEFKKK